MYPWLRIISSFLLTDSIKTSRGSFKSRKRDPDIFSFNNRRLLHGRTEFDPNSGHRHLQGYYMDRDEIIGRLNYLKQQL